MPLVSITCPYCLTANNAFAVTGFRRVKRPGVEGKPSYTNAEAIGECAACGSYVVLFFSISQNAGERYNLPSEAGLLNEATLANNVNTKLRGYLPRPPKPSIPQHLPANVAKSFLGAEKARMAQLWTEAASSYGKAIDRAISPMMPDDGKRRTLGQKLTLIKENGDLPQALTDWIGVVLQDRNFAAHDDDMDFESEAEITPIRDFASILLTYLFTMPARVKAAREQD